MDIARNFSKLCFFTLSVSLVACVQTSSTKNNFATDVAFLQQHTDVVLLKNSSSPAQVAVIPAMQGRVMTSAVKPEGESYGWVNYSAIAAGKRQPQINVFGGEDRFWLGPEGGQFSIFFAPEESQTFANWQTPEALDWGAWSVVQQNAQSIQLQKNFNLINHAGSHFKLQTHRTVSLLDRTTAEKNLHTVLPQQVQFVGYESNNQVTNLGHNEWRAESGLLSVWILGMLKHSAQTVVVIPFQTGPEDQFGPIVKDDYFGKVPSDRLIVDKEKGVLFFKADGQMRTKIGISPRRAKSLSGSYAPETNTLTIVQVVLPSTPMPYVNSQWTDDDAAVDPYQGDVINSYNDGPNDSGAILGPFYELESSSPALALTPGESAQHLHRTYHFQGDVKALNKLAKQLLGVSIQQIASAF